MATSVTQTLRAHPASTDLTQGGQSDQPSDDPSKKMTSGAHAFLPNSASPPIPFESAPKTSMPASAGNMEAPQSPMASIEALFKQLQALVAMLTGEETPSTESEAPAPSQPSAPSQPPESGQTPAAKDKPPASDAAAPPAGEASPSSESDSSSKAADGDARRKARADGSSEAEKAGAEKRANRGGRSDSAEDADGGKAAAPEHASGDPAMGGAEEGTGPDGAEDGAGPDGAPAALDGTPQAANVSEFETINPGEGPEMITDANGKFVFNGIVDDSFLPEDVKAGMKQAVTENKDLSFFQDNFNNEQDMYQYMVHMANLESARGTVLENSEDAIGSNTGGSAGYMHLHMNYGLEPQIHGSPLNTEGWTKEEVLGDYSKYTELTMKHLDGSYKATGGDADAAQGIWWTGGQPGDEQTAKAGRYYRQALSGGTGVNHNTGAAYA